MVIRPVEARDRADWLRMRQALWPDEDGEPGIEAYFREPTPESVVLVAEGAGGLVGFAEVSTRAYADGCETSPVGYLEGWFVAAEVRGTGVGRALVEAAEAWTRDRGLREFASDAELTNEASIRAHLALGFEEAGRLVCFIKRV